MVEINDISLASESDDIIRLDVKFPWEYRDRHQNGRNGFGVVRVQRDGTTYRMISLK